MMRVDFGSVEANLKNKLKQSQEEAVKRKLTSIAFDATQWSKRGGNLASSGVGRGGGVDTGAYITSFSFNVGRGRPRGRSSRGRPRNQSPDQKAMQGYSLLLEDINRLDLKNTTSLTLRNGSPHATVVEYKHGLNVFGKLKVKYGNRR